MATSAQLCPGQTEEVWPPHNLQSWTMTQSAAQLRRLKLTLANRCMQRCAHWLWGAVRVAVRARATHLLSYTNRRMLPFCSSCVHPTQALASLQGLFLPEGYPASTTRDYLPYMLWTFPTHGMSNSAAGGKGPGGQSM
jgi:hypothetical protein